jgi:hypothetical protein
LLREAFLRLEKTFLPDADNRLPGDSVLVFYQLDAVVFGYFGQP